MKKVWASRRGSTELIRVQYIIVECAVYIFQMLLLYPGTRSHCSQLYDIPQSFDAVLRPLSVVETSYTETWHPTEPNPSSYNRGTEPLISLVEHSAPDPSCTWRLRFSSRWSRSCGCGLWLSSRLWYPPAGSHTRTSQAGWCSLLDRVSLSKCLSVNVLSFKLNVCMCVRLFSCLIAWLSKSHFADLSVCRAI